MKAGRLQAKGSHTKFKIGTLLFLLQGSNFQYKVYFKANENGSFGTFFTALPLKSSDITFFENTPVKGGLKCVGR